MSDPKAWIAGIGMITPVGGDAAMTSASVRAGVSWFRETDYFNKTMQKICMALVPDEALPELDDFVCETLKPDWRDSRMLQMSHAAIVQALGDMVLSAPPPILFAGPEIYPNTSYARMPDMMAALNGQTGVEFERTRSRFLNTGRAGVFEALDLAFRYLVDQNLPAVLVGGADSYQCPEVLLELDREDRIKVEEAADFFVPGEAAGFVLLVRDRASALVVDGHVAALHAPGIAHESGHLYSGKPLRGEGLAQAFGAALSGRPKNGIRRIYSSMNGERVWAREYGVAVTRTRDYFHEDCETIHPADCYGDLGGATGAVLIGLAAQKPSPQTVPALIYGSSDQGYCGAACLVMERA